MFWQVIEELRALYMCGNDALPGAHPVLSTTLTSYKPCSAPPLVERVNDNVPKVVSTPCPQKRSPRYDACAQENRFGGILTPTLPPFVPARGHQKDLSYRAPRPSSPSPPRFCLLDTNNVIFPIEHSVYFHLLLNDLTIGHHGHHLHALDHDYIILLCLLLQGRLPIRPVVILRRRVPLESLSNRLDHLAEPVEI